MPRSRARLCRPRSSRVPVYLPPEVCLLIGNYLTGADLIASARVSKEWNKIFTPFLFKSLNLNACGRAIKWENVDPLGTYIRATLETTVKGYSCLLSSTALDRNGHCIRYLAILQNQAYTTDTFAAVRSLRNLCIVAHRERECDSVMNVLYESSKVLLTINHGLQNLDLHCIDLCGTLSWIAQECPTLERLRLPGSDFNLSDMVQVFRSCRSLAFLSTHTSYVSSSEKDAELLLDASSLTDLQELEMGNLCYEHAVFLFQLLPCCPRLKSIYVGAASYTGLADELRLDCCPELAKITIENIRYMDDDMDDVSKILDNCPPSVTDVSFIDCNLDHITLRSLRPLFASLTSVCFNAVDQCDLKVKKWKIGERNPMASRMASEIFRSCPNLLHFECPLLHGILGSLSELNARSVAHQTVKPSLWGSSLKLKTLKIGELQLCPHIEEGMARSVVPLAVMSALETVSFARITAASNRILMECTGGWYEHDDKNQLSRSKLEKDRDLQWVLKTWPNLASYSTEGRW